MRAVTRPGSVIDYVEQFAVASDRFAAAVGAVDPTAEVPSCPGWSTYDVVVHLGNVYGRAATVLETGREAPVQRDEPASRRPGQVAEWYAAKAEDLYQVLRSTPEDRACWNFAFGTGSAAFWQRRQLHETLVHHVDLWLAGAAEPVVAEEVAADGVDEVLRVFLHRMHHRGHPADLVAPVSLLATDVNRSWTVLPGGWGTPGHRGGREAGGVPAQRGSQALGGQRPEPTVVDGMVPEVDRVEGSAAALMRLLWKRLPTVRRFVRYVGDQNRIERFLDSRLTP